MARPAIATAKLYTEEYELVATHRFAEAMRPVFEIAGVEYGRVDFGLVDGRPQIYEINSNPDVKLRPKPSGNCYAEQEQRPVPEKLPRGDARDRLFRGRRGRAGVARSR